MVGNFLTSTPGVKDYGEGMVLMDLEDALRVVTGRSSGSQIRADYLPHDFTLGAIRGRSSLGFRALLGSPRR